MIPEESTTHDIPRETHLHHLPQNCTLYLSHPCISPAGIIFGIQQVFNRYVRTRTHRYTHTHTHTHTQTHTNTHTFWYSTGDTAIINSCISFLLHSHCAKIDSTVGFLSCSKEGRVDRSLLGSSAKALVWDLEEETLKNNHLRRSATTLGFTRS